MVAPQRQRGADFVRVRASVVDPDDTSPVAALVVKNLLDNVRRGGQIAESRCKRSAKVMQRPWHDAIAEPSVECSLGARPTGKPAVRAIAEKGIPTYHARNARDDAQRER